MPFDARLWLLILTPILLNAGCFISAEEHARRLDPDGDGLPWPQDCDSTHSEIGGEEVIYDGLDNDCNAVTLDDDLDNDGFAVTDDCDDEDEDIQIGAPEICTDGVDQDCDGEVDGVGELCETDLPCTQDAACTRYGDEGEQVCGCSCPDQGYIAWSLNPICHAGNCPMDYAPVTIGGTVSSCPEELFESISSATDSNELLFTIHCGERDISDLLRWYTEDRSTDLEIYAELHYSVEEEKPRVTLLFRSAVLKNIDALYLDFNDFTCEGIAELTFSYQDVDRVYQPTFPAETRLAGLPF